ncbi:MAG: hypothetical protein RLZZ132_972, partial [Bacteroidota bacterium]
SIRGIRRFMNHNKVSLNSDMFSALGIEVLGSGNP